MSSVTPLPPPLGLDPAPFVRRFGAAPEVAVRAPGRINLIGGHLDYHESFVLPAAIDRAIWLHGCRRTDGRVRVYSEMYQLSVEFRLDPDQVNPNVHPSGVRPAQTIFSSAALQGPNRHPVALGRYLQGVIHALAARHPVEIGCDVLLRGDLPPAAGLSSSSALVTGFAALVAHLQGHALEPLELAQIGCEAEHWYGTTGGIMDQYVIAHGQAGHALFIDCRHLSHQAVLLPASTQIVVADTGTRRQQIATPFAHRRREAEQGLAILQRLVPGIATLRDVDLETLGRCREALFDADSSGTLWRRCRHVVTETGRVQAAVSALRRGDVAALGQLMTQAHTSLRDDYEVGSPEQDAMVQRALELDGCYGARMHGGGFGGSTVNLVAAEGTHAFCRGLAERYQELAGREPTIFGVSPSEGLQVFALPSP